MPPLPPTWRLWGSYLSLRSWGTVREDYSAAGDAWEYFTHEDATRRAYRWNEDGLLGICDDAQRLCFAVALWNGKDTILKERPFGLTGPEGNHGEDAKDYWFFLDNVPSHAYMRALYKYPHGAFPYERLRAENARRSRDQGEFELLDTGIFDESRYFDVGIEYAKSTPTDILIRITLANRGPDAATIDLLPTLWFRNNWSWGAAGYRPSLSAIASAGGECCQILADHESLGRYHLTCEGDPELLFTENDSNNRALFGSPNASPYVKDAFHEYVVHGNTASVNPACVGTKAAASYRFTVAGGAEQVVRLRLSTDVSGPGAFGAAFDEVFRERIAEADAFYSGLSAPETSSEERAIQRQALAGLLWSKQFYHYDVERWINGDPAFPPPPAERCTGRNHGWIHLNNHDIISMPDTWEYPWYAAWDLAFHTIPLAMVDPEFAKNQLILLLREWFMHPNGQLPAYEWQFSDVNPPVHAWAAMRVYQIERRATGVGDLKFLERVFHKLLINFTWWVNRKDAEGRNVFQGGFLGLDNIGVFNRSADLPPGVRLDQSDGTSWMAMYCLNMLAIALELARHDDAYEDVATKFLEHYFYIAHALNARTTSGGDPDDLWDEEDQFYYDLLRLPDGTSRFIRVRSMVGLIPLLAVETLDAELLRQLSGFRERLEWFMRHRSDLVGDAASITRAGEADRRLFAVVSEPRLRAILRRMLDETEFLSPHGLRSVSRWHAAHPFRLVVNGRDGGEVEYEPAESRSGLFGGNSNWRGPVWFPLNYLIIEALQKFDWYYGATFRVEHPVGSGRMLTLWEVSVELSRRLIGLFVPHEGRRPAFGDSPLLQSDPHWREHLLFNEYFDGDTGAGLGASHQTGWTALVAKLIQQSGVPKVT
jgi:hypothetical protein